MKKTLSSVIKYIFFLGLGVFLIWWSLRQIPDDKWNEFIQSLTNARFWLVIPVFFILSASHLLRALRWRILMQPMGYTPTIKNTFSAVMIGYLANLAVPRLGEVLKCTILARYEKVPAEKLVGTIVAERAFDVISLALVFLLSFTLQYDIVGSYAKEVINELFKTKAGSFSINKIIIAVAVVIILIVALRIWFNQFSHLKIVIAIQKILKGIWEGLNSIRNVKQKGLFIFYSITIWGLYIVGTWVGLYATHGTTGLGLKDAISALAFASIGMILTPGGIGAYAYFMAKVLERSDIPFTLGYANGTLQWFAQFAIVVIVGFACVILLPIINKHKPNMNNNETR
ncbi:MAG: flippase-like domain-containing protein [Bacteroidetes bacterium]|nr:flippase-like domain-containing protein [Bacteroidota bacterium]MBS1650029.1 flippase-like domain-containing protein [Bacteroidota bacterium]